MAEKVLSVLAVSHAAIFFVVVIVSAVTDLLRRKIYNWVCVTGVLSGLFLAYVRGGVGDFSALLSAPVSLSASIIAGVIGFSVFLVIYLAGGVGAGDVKLMAAVGFLTNLRFILWVMLYSAFAGMPIALLVLYLRGEMREGLTRSFRGLLFRYRRNSPVVPENGEAKAKEEGIKEDNNAEPVTVPYGVAVCIGVLLAVWKFMERGFALPF